MLNGTWLLKPIGVNSPQEFFGDFHPVEGIDGFIPVRVDVGISDASRERFSAAVVTLWLFTVLFSRGEGVRMG